MERVNGNVSECDTEAKIVPKMGKDDKKKQKRKAKQNKQKKKTV